MKRDSNSDLAAERGLSNEEYSQFLRRKSEVLCGSYRSLEEFKVAEKRFEQDEARLRLNRQSLETAAA